MQARELRNNNFDLLRILAAVQVVISHCIHHLKLDKTTAAFELLEKFPGVPVFFTISGFLISASFEKNPELSTYFRNRALRIFPALWACLFFSIVTAALFGGVNFINPVTLPWVLGQLSIVQFFNPDFLRGYGTGVLNGSLWTITVELQFYLLIPLLYLGMTKLKFNRAMPWMVLLFFFVIAVLLKQIPFTERQNKWIAVTFFPHFYLFMAGLVLQRMHAHQFDIVYNKGLWWAIALLLFSYFVPEFTLKPFLEKLILSIFTVSLAYTLPGLARKILQGNDISYGVYIYHAPVLNILVEKGMTGSYSSLWIILALTLLLAALSWKLLEKRFIAMKKKGILINS